MNAAIPYLCPDHGHPLQLEGDARWACRAGCHFPLVGGIPRFVESSIYAGSFGLQWNTFRRTQLDSYTGTTISRDRLARMVGGLDRVRGREVLEVGCGAGRFTEVLLAAGARVQAVDLSSAVEANLANCGRHPGHRVCQADVRRLPFRPGSFDVVICVGVIQHTPSPEETIAALAAQVRAGGLLVVDHYAPNYAVTPPRQALRSVLLGLPPEAALAACGAVVQALWPVHVEAYARRAEPAWAAVLAHLQAASPVVDYQQAYPQLSAAHMAEWALLDTHDTVTDAHKHLRSAEQVGAALRQCGLERISTSYGGNGVEASAWRPAGQEPPAPAGWAVEPAPAPQAAAALPPAVNGPLEQGLSLLAVGDVAGALPRLFEAYQARPHDQRTVLAVAEACVLAGEPGTAESVLGAYLRHVPGDREAADRLAGLGGPNPVPGAATPSQGRAPQAATPPPAIAGMRTNASTPRRARAGRILFVALAHSTHTHSWIALLEGQGYEVRLFGIQGFKPPASFKIPTTTFTPTTPGGPYDPVEERRQLAALIREWRPDVVHTLGIDPAAYIFYQAREEHRLQGVGRWAMTCRGGSDLYLKRFSGERSNLGILLGACDVFVADNHESYAFAHELGLPQGRASETGPVPGTGGIDVAELQALVSAPPSRREKIILWPKAYECEWSKGLPVLEALKLAWDDIRPCTIVMTAMQDDDVPRWMNLLPPDLRAACRTFDRTPRLELLGAMAKARVLLAPSLVDGVPNSLYEAMATGAMPIVSPLGSITRAVTPENTLFARNLFPAEIADALVRAMTDDALVDATAARNLELVRRTWDRAVVRAKVLPLYRRLAGVSP